jgi:iron complex outermembrane recepter protein
MTSHSIQSINTAHNVLELISTLTKHTGIFIMHCITREIATPLFITGVLVTLLSSGSVHADDSMEDYLDLPLEALLSMEVTSVSKKKQSLNEAAAAIFVITQEDIRRSGVTSIPEALRLAPGVQVAKIDANKWAISSRGFNTQFVNKLLVLIDGRSVYTPSYSGVYWDAQDTLLEDIDRIEVIRGPGATLWGANAVNGVINIITKPASDTQGGLVVAGAGNEEKTFGGFRYGSDLNANTQGRVYLKYNRRDSNYQPSTDTQAGDDWKSLRGGFRLDSQVSENDHWTLQGDIYDAEENQTLNLWQDPSDPDNMIYQPFYLAENLADEVDSSGWNLLTRLDHAFSNQSNLSLQLYYDHTKRAEAFAVQEQDTLDIDLQHQIRLFDNHELIWGLGYRHIQDDFTNSYIVQFLPDSSSSDLYSAFLQDEIELLPNRLRLTLGSKFEHNDFTGFEFQPNARLVWLASEQSTLWAAVSRVVRTPSRLEIGSRIVSRIVPLPPTYTPTAFYTVGNENFDSEKLLAYEAGYRFQPRSNASFDLSLFYNNYDNLQTFEQSTSTFTDIIFDNKLTAQTYGVELVAEWLPMEWWRLQTNYSYIHISAQLDSDSNDPISITNIAEGSTPTHHASLRSMMDLSHAVSFDLWVYYVDELNTTSYSAAEPISEYTSLNARIAWKPSDDLELSLVGQNLADNRHMEFVGENLLTKTEVERSVYAKIHWNF